MVLGEFRIDGGCKVRPIINCNRWQREPCPPLKRMLCLAPMERSLSIPSDPAAIDKVESFLTELCAEWGLSDDEAGDLIIAGTEAANNAILHGNRRCRELQVRLQAQVRQVGGTRLLELTVCDEGQGLPDEAPEDPTSPEHLLDISGRGLLIIRHLMDEVRIEALEPGTRVVMIKSLA